MSTTGTTAFNLNMADLIEEAFERCGAELRTGYDLRTARRSVNLLTIEWANRGLNLWTVEQGQIVMNTGQAIYPLPVDTIDLLDMVTRQYNGQQTNQIDININRISESTYSTIPNKNATGRPIQVYVNRQTPIPNITLWQVPNTNSYIFRYWYLRRAQDAGQPGSNTMDVPFRFVPALVAGLAYHVAIKSPDSADRIPMLKQMYDEAWDQAADEDREKAPLRIAPRQYFR